MASGAHCPCFLKPQQREYPRGSAVSAVMEASRAYQVGRWRCLRIHVCVLLVLLRVHVCVFLAIQRHGDLR